MSHSNPERNERLNQILNQIRERADLPSHWTPTWADVNFLLSLLDSQATEAEEDCERRLIEAAKYRAEMEIGRENTAARLIRDAATSMRDRCVQKVKSVAQTHREMAEKFKGKEMGELQAIRAEECDTLVGILQSITPEVETEAR